jgi:hypothetical protein
MPTTPPDPVDAFFQREALAHPGLLVPKLVEAVAEL